MLINVAEERFRRGRIALERARVVEALASFEAAISLERRLGTGTIQARYLSYYGLCLALTGKRVRDGVGFCRQATTLEPYHPDFHWNFGIALLRARKRRKAFAVLHAGLAIEPDHRGIRRELRRMGQRRRVALPFLDRGHPVNVFLGKMSSGPNGNGKR